MTDYQSDPLRRSNCGTNAGFNQHVKYRERACEPCRVANRTYINAYYIRTGRYKNVRFPTELFGALIAACPDVDIVEQARRSLGPGIVEACIERASEVPAA